MRRNDSAAPFYTFSDDGTKIVNGRNDGFLVLQLPAAAERASSTLSTQPMQQHTLVRVRNEQTLGGVALVATHSQCPYAAVVSTTGCAGVSVTPHRCVLLMDLNTNELVTQMHFDDDVVGLKLNKRRLVVATIKAVHSFDIDTLDPLPVVKLQHPVVAASLDAGASPVTLALTGWIDSMLYDGYGLNVTVNQRTVANLGRTRADLAAASTRELSPNSPLTPAAAAAAGTCYLLIAQSMDANDPNRGDVLLVEAATFHKVAVVPAHRSTVTLIECCALGHRFATTSAKGNVIRVFACPSGQLLALFRRGTQEALIYSISMSADGGVVAATSSQGTLHIFRDDNVASSAGSIKETSPGRTAASLFSALNIGQSTATIAADAGGSAAGASGPETPQAVLVSSEGVRSIAKINTRKERTICCLSLDGSLLNVLSPPLNGGDIPGNVKQYQLSTMKLLHDIAL